MGCSIQYRFFYSAGMCTVEGNTGTISVMGAVYSAGMCTAEGNTGTIPAIVVSPRTATTG